ncbi:MAG TPA: hypothetical protein VGX92_09160 [Pyrinomonadaceae bacterium]|jgi:hypothetical protein|nr:hypothetical protein [Pyrinomonadaceae bacterium]
MTIYKASSAGVGGWLAFELSVLRRLKFRSVALPFGGEPYLGIYLKHWGVRVAANDLARWSSTKAAAFIENNTERLTEDDVAALMEDTYMPRDESGNAALRRWFNETDALWFDNLRENAERMESPAKHALALSTGMMVGDYVLSFDDETRRLRQPLALPRVFERVWQREPHPVNNSQRNLSANMEAREFVAQQHTDLLFLRLPHASNKQEQRRSAPSAWREEWVRGDDGFWDEMEKRCAGRLGSYAETKQQYLSFVEDLLQTSAHLPLWAIAYAENGFVSTADLVECINRVRKVGTVYAKDFSELMGARATIITA